MIAHPHDTLPTAELVALVAGPAIYLLGHVLFRLRMAGSISWRRLAGAIACVLVGLVGLESLRLSSSPGLLVAVLAIVIASEQIAGRRRAIAASRPRSSDWKRAPQREDVLFRRRRVAPMIDAEPPRGPTAVLRKAILAAAESPRMQRGVRRHGMRLGAARFVAGETLDQAVVVLRGLNEKGLVANTTLLGEGVNDEAETRVVVESYKEIFDRIAAEKLRVNVALKLTHLGLGFDEQLARANIGELVAHAAQLGNFVRLDMEESAFVDATLRVYRGLREEGHENVGTVLQSYLYRTPGDLEALLDLSPNLRFVKGAYLEPPDLAYPEKADVDAAYASLVERSLSAGGFTAIATHDTALIAQAIAYAKANGIGRDRFQFQMLYGVRGKLQLDLVAKGYDVLVATPYGPDWYRYLMRRLAERPANVLFIAKNMVRR